MRPPSALCLVPLSPSPACVLPWVVGSTAIHMQGLRGTHVCVHCVHPVHPASHLPLGLEPPGSFLGPWCGHKCPGRKSLAVPQKEQQSDRRGAELTAVPALGPKGSHSSPGASPLAVPMQSTAPRGCGGTDCRQEPRHIGGPLTLCPSRGCPGLEQEPTQRS